MKLLHNTGECEVTSFVETVNYDLISIFPTATLECKGRPTKYSNKINDIVSVSGLINIIGLPLSKALKLQVPVTFMSVCAFLPNALNGSEMALKLLEDSQKRTMT